jgi:3-oxoacyl-[acyl-carrier protein] reductase
VGDPFDRIAVGAESRFSHRVSESDIDAFATLSGDSNPLHTDSEFAKARGFQGRVAHGMLGAAFLSRVIGTMLPGPGALWISQSFRFLLPIYAGEQIEVVVRLTHKSRATRWLVLATEILKQGGQRAMTGEAKVMLPVETKKMALKEMVALVTGGSRGIGAAIARRLAEAGVAVSVNFRNRADAAEQVLQEIVAVGGRGIAIQADVSQEGSARKLFETTLEHFGRIDIVINNATPPILQKSIGDLHYADFVPFLDTYLRSSLEITQLAIPGMKERRYGRIVNLATSFVWGVPPPELAPYVTAKSALVGLSKAMAVELGPWGITVNLVSPSVVFTDLNATLGVSRGVLALRHPLQRLARPEDVAEAVLFLASEQGAFINGANIPVAGGEVMM